MTTRYRMKKNQDGTPARKTSADQNRPRLKRRPELEKQTKGQLKKQRARNPIAGEWRREDG